MGHLRSHRRHPLVPDTAPSPSSMVFPQQQLRPHTFRLRSLVQHVWTAQRYHQRKYI